MTLRVQRCGRADRERWNTFVGSHPEGSPYHRFEWSEAVQAAYGHKAYRLAAVVSGRISGVLPLVHMKTPLRGGELVSLPYCDVGGILAEHGEAADDLRSSALELARELGVGSLELRGSGDGTQEAPEEDGVNKVRMLLDLPDGSEALWDSFKSKLRSQVRKAEKNGLAFRWGAGPEDRDAFYTVFSKNMRDLGSPVHSRSWVYAVLERYGDNARLGLVYSGRVPVGGGILLHSGEVVSLPWASTSREHNHLAPNMLLYWKLLEYSADAGFKRFDFGRSTPEEGTYRFKRQWGAKPVSLHWERVGPSGDPCPAGTPVGSGARQRVARLWSRLPLAVANRVGPRLRKHISL